MRGRWIWERIATSKLPMRIGDAWAEVREKDDEDGTKGKEVKMAVLASEQFDCAPPLCRRRHRLGREATTSFCRQEGIDQCCARALLADGHDVKFTTTDSLDKAI